MECNIFDYGMNGEGVSKIDGKICLIENALVDEIVDCEIVSSLKNYATAKTTNIIKPSIHRTNPPCPYFNECGGCSLQHMDYSEQLKFKKLLVQKTLKKVANISFEVSDCVPCDTQFEYRNKCSFNFLNTKAGFYKQNSNDIVQIDKCLLANPNINRIYNIFINSFDDYKEIKHLVVREIANQILVGVVATTEINLTQFADTLSKNFNNFGLYLIINNRNDSVILSGKTKHITGIKGIEINNFGLNYFVDLFGFHQTNINIQNKLYKKVLEFVSDNEFVINGFSGQGLLSAILATKAKKVVGIEINKSSHISAENLKQRNKISNLTNILGDFNKEFSTFKTKASTVVLDPSKKGCGKEVMNKINGIENIIYISCNPIALAKNLRELQNYEIEQIIPFDMFPNTTSVETLVKLKLKK